MKTSLHQQLKQRIDRLPNGAVVSVADFTDLAKPKTVSKMLTRLQEEGAIERVMRSIFWKTNERPCPSPNDVAEALARENGWETAPTKETALVLFGMEEDLPLVWTYVTDGTNRTYSYGKHTITFTHAASRAFGSMRKATRTLVQCIKAYGKEHLSDEKIRKLADKVRGWDYKALKEETSGASHWVKTAVRRVCSFAKMKVEVRA